MAASPLPINEFLSTGATFAADLAFVPATTGSHLPKILHIRYYAIATIDAAPGSAAELMGLYIVLVVGTYLVPRQLRFKYWKRWMRIELLLWSVALIGGLGTYYAWYIASFRYQVGVVSATTRTHSSQLQ